MSLASLFGAGSRSVQTRNPAAPRASGDFLTRFARELEGLAAKAPQSVRPAADRAARSPRAVLAGLGVVAVGAGLLLATNKHTRAGVAAMAGALMGLSAGKKGGRGFGF